MEFFKSERVIDFMKYRAVFLTVSTILCVLSIASFWWPGPNWGIDFSGGTELQLHFQGNVNTSELRTAMNSFGYRSPDVVAVQGVQNTYLVRVQETTALPAGIDQTIRQKVVANVPNVEIVSLQVSPGGNRVSVRMAENVEPSLIQTSFEQAGLRLHGDVHRFGPESDNVFQADLVGVADEIVRKLQERFGERAPTVADRIDWVGAKAGAQLREAAIRSLLYTVLFIMVYVAFRFDLRFAPGAVIALFHDALVTFGFFVLIQKEFNLTIVAALLTIVGYSINDTMVIYDRIRENSVRHRNMSLRDLINLSQSQTLSRTIITSGVTLLSISAFFIWGTDVIKDMSLALLVGFISGVYSTIYIAAPLTEWMDTNVFAKRRPTGRAVVIR